VTVGAILLPWYILVDRKCMKKLFEEPVRDLPNTVEDRYKKRVKLSLSAQYRCIGGAEV